MRRRDIVATGGCQCGAVRYRASAMLDNAHLCHCRMCQKATGGLFAALVAAPDDALEWTRGTPAVFRSSERVERGFCAACGTPLFYHGLDGGRTNLTIGSLDNPAAFPPIDQMGSEARMPWFETLPALPDQGATEDEDPEWAAAIRRSNRQAPDGD
ncbi:GFA family protein [Sphingomonas sp. MMS12-HWE2-04]|uniref:GFA family protein n=1 Tax=Sphingomonas sp. MMS12-HWE2-04 TaxID=3234199 RepID=UPI00384DF60C